MQTCKIVHGWLPTMHMLSHITGINQCPGCTSRDETIDHMILCPNWLMLKKQEEIMQDLRKKGLSSKVPTQVMNVLE